MRFIKNMLPMFLLLIVCAFVQSIQAQTDTCLPSTPRANFDFNNWINCRVELLVSTAIEQRGTNKQVQAPSISDASTSLVDKTEAPDLVGLALNFAGISKGSDESKNVNSITTTAFAVYAAASQIDPLDPVFYKKNSNLRNFSFTFGREDASESNSNQASTILGFKVLFLNRRDISRKDNVKLLNDLVLKSEETTTDFVNTATEVQDYLYKVLPPVLKLPTTTTKTEFINTRLNSENITATLNLLTQEQKEEVERILKKRITSEVNLAEQIETTYETIRRKPQLSLTFQSKRPSGNGADEYRTGLLFDMGVVNRLNLALNGTFDYKDSKSIGGDTRGGRFAAEAYYRLNSGKNLLFTGKDPFLLSFSGEGKWMSSEKPTYQGQARLTIPIFDGINIPLSVTYANRRELIKESKVRGNFGVTFDLAKALKGFKP